MNLRKYLYLVISLMLVCNLAMMFYHFYDTIFPTSYVQIDASTKAEVEKVVQNNDIFNAALLLAKPYYGDIDIEQANIAIEKIVEEVRPRIKDKDDPQEIIEIINSYLHDEFQIQPDRTLAIEDILLDKVLENKKGNCVGLSLLYLALAERLDLPIFPKVVPSHIFVYYDDGITTFNIETTLMDFLRTDSYYDDNFPDPERYHKIEKLNNRQVLGIFMNNLGNFLRQDPMALDIQKKALFLFPDSPAIHNNTAHALWLLKERKKAKSHLLKSLELDPTSWRSKKLIGGLYYEMGDYKKAADFFVESIDLLKKSVKISAEYPNELPEKEKLIEWAGQLLQNDEADYGNILGYGLILFQQQEYELSNQLFAHALKLYPDQLRTHSFYAKSNFHTSNYELARNHEQIADQSGQLDKPYKDSLTFIIDTIADCYMSLSQSRAMLKKYDLALTNIRKAIEIGGPKSQYYSSLAGTYKLMGDRAEAIRNYEKALELDPSDIFAQEKLSELQFKEVE